MSYGLRVHSTATGYTTNAGTLAANTGIGIPLPPAGALAVKPKAPAKAKATAAADAMPLPRGILGGGKR